VLPQKIGVNPHIGGYMPSAEETARAARWARAEAAKKLAEANKGGYDREEIPTFEYLALEENKCQVFRIVGNIVEQHLSPTDPIVVESSVARADIGSNEWVTIVWSQDSDHPMRILRNKLTKGTWDKATKTKTYDLAGCELLKHFITNGSDSPYATGMQPTKSILMNIIDRSDDWCAKNNHTKLLAWEVSEKDGKLYPKLGIRQSLYKALDSKTEETQLFFDEIDFVVRRFDQSSRPSKDEAFKVHWHEEKTAITKYSNSDGVDYYSKIHKDTFLTKEEKAYELYSLEDIPFLSRPTPIAVIMKKMEKFIKKVDAKYSDWNIWNKCIEWKAKELDELRAKKAGVVEDTHKTTPIHETASVSVLHSDEKSDDLPGFQEEKVEEKAVETPKTPDKPTRVKIKSRWTEAELKVFPHLNKMPKDQQDLIEAINTDGEGEILWTEGNEPDSSCGSCELPLLDEITVCPKCGVDYS
jgi:hypothetical protein